MSAKAALALAIKHMPPTKAGRAICVRAKAGLVRAKARRYIRANASADDFEIPSHFWWASGGAALKQNWATGDFETWIDHTIHLRAYGVEFLRQGILDMLGIADVTPERPETITVDAQATPKHKSGRRSADFWEDLWVEIATQLYVGDLEPKVQANIEKAMAEWIYQNGFSASESTVRERASNLMKSLNKRG